MVCNSIVTKNVGIPDGIYKRTTYYFSTILKRKKKDKMQQKFQLFILFAELVVQHFLLIVEVYLAAIDKGVDNIAATHVKDISFGHY